MALASLADRAPVSQAEGAKDRSLPGKVTGRLKCAMDAMIWEGKSRPEAAKRANMSEHSLYAALRRPHVKQYYLTELEVLRSSERARNLHALIQVRDQTGNQMARVQAVKALEQLAEDANKPGSGHSAPQAPGLTVIIGVQTPQAIPEPHAVIDVTQASD
jgi:hypothetical protein